MRPRLRATAITAALLALVAACRSHPAPASEPPNADAAAPPPPAPDAAAEAPSRAPADAPEALDPHVEMRLIEYRINEIEDLLAADAIAPSSLDPSGIWRVDAFVFMAFRTGESAWTFTLLPTEPDLRMPPGNAPDWFRVTAAAGEGFTGKIQADLDVWLEADAELAAGGSALHVSCREKDGSVAFDVVLDRGLGLETRDSLRAAVEWLTNRLRTLEAENPERG